MDLLGNLVPHDRLELWRLQADVREEETLMVWVKLPYDSVLRIQREEVPLPDGVEGLWCCICHSIFYLVAMASQIVCVSHKYSGCLP